MKKNSLILLLLLFTAFFWEGSTAFAQKQGRAKIDSLEAVLKIAKEDTNKVNTLNNLAGRLRDINPDTSIILSSQALQLAEKIKWQFGIANAELSLGTF